MGAEVHIGLVHHHHRLRVGVCNLPEGVERQVPAGGGVGVGDDHAAVAPQKLLHRHTEILVQGNLPVVQAEELSVDRVKAVCNVGEHHSLPRGKEGVEAHGQHLVGAVAHKDLLRAQAVVGGDGLPHFGALRVGIEPQGAARLLPDGLRHHGGGGVGVFIGVQLDKLPVPGLLPRRIGHQSPDPFAPEFLHVSSSPVRRIFLMFFSALLRGSMSSWPQP